MLATVDLKRELDHATYERSYRPLRDQLAALQRSVFEAKIPVLLVFEGWDTAGKGDTIEKVLGRVDPRGYEVHVTRDPTEEERRRPYLWRFWSRLPERGTIGIFDRSWYRRVLGDRVSGNVPREVWEPAFEELNQFERMLHDDGALIVKFFLHLGKAEQRRRLEKLAKSKYEGWRVTKGDWKAHARYAQYARAADEMLERTSTAWAPWTVVPATDKRYRRVRVFETLVEALTGALERHHARTAAPAKPARKTAPKEPLHSVLDRVDLSRKLPLQRYERQLDRLQGRLRELEFACYQAQVPVVVAYEGWDAAGKGGNIKRLVGALDPRGYSVLPISAPKGDEATHHYLWRFWKRVPKAGHLAVFDRTWYGRVLVERVEGFCTEAEWRRAYQEIIEFERSLVDAGAVLVKFWLHVSKEEQLARFKERQRDATRRYKITDDDWRNREKWDAYHLAVHDMITRTSTASAPWTIVESEDKHWARVRCLKAVVQAVEKRLKR
jgi:polyphosphate:AMP phosphotransferase